ncbi:MAG: hypothetical protein QM635_04305 [Microbacteriaceae bacterium]
MALSRKQKKELERLRHDAGVLLKDQREVLEHAGAVVRDAGRQAADYARDEVAPRVRDTYESRVQPAVDRGAAAVRNAAHTTRTRITDDVLPQVGAAVGSAIAALDVTSLPEVKAAIRKASRRADTARRVALSGSTAKKASAVARGGAASGGVGKYILIGLGVVVVAGIAYAAWETLRADDDLWIDDEVDAVDDAGAETPED